MQMVTINEEGNQRLRVL